MSKQKRFLLQENELPTQWYNLQADMITKPLPPLNPATQEPLTVEDLAHIFSEECSRQELDMEHAWIDIPEEVQDKYRYYRATPLVRAYALEEALDTPAIIRKTKCDRILKRKAQFKRKTKCTKKTNIYPAISQTPLASRCVK